MFCEEADLFFRDPHVHIKPPNRYGVLYLLRRDIFKCFGIDPTTSKPIEFRAEWPGAMALLAGFDLLGKFLAGNDDSMGVGKRFKAFLERYAAALSVSDRDTIYHLRNALLHSFGLYSKDQKTGEEYRFFLTACGGVPLVRHEPFKPYYLDLRVLHEVFEAAVVAYQNDIEIGPNASSLQWNFWAMFANYGWICIT